MSVRVACSGFPVSKARYFARFPTVEIASTFTRLPRSGTVERWRAEFPGDAKIALVVWKGVTHPLSPAAAERLRPAPEKMRLLRYGHFRRTSEVKEAWRLFELAAEALEPKFLVFRTPATFYPGADHLRDMYAFFKDLRRRGAVPVWEPAGGGWEDRLIKKVCLDLGLVHGVDPLRGESLCGGVNYFRVGGPPGRAKGDALSDGELRLVADRCAGKPSYVVLENRAMWRDAARLEALIDPVGAAIASRLSGRGR